MIVVTGGAGFIGSNLVSRGTQLPFREKITVVDFLGSGEKWRNLASCCLFDFVHPENIFSFLHGHESQITHLIHLGAFSSTRETEGDQVIATNFHLSTRLWNWCVEAEVPFIYASSAATYGSGDQGFQDRWDEAYLSSLRPLNLYAWSKHLFDQWVAQRVQEGGPRPPQWVGLKFFNVYGPQEYHKGDQKSIICKMVESLQAHHPLQLFKSAHPSWGDGEQARDFVWVEDCVDVIFWICQNPHVEGFFNVGSGEARTFREVAQMVIKTWGQPASLKFVDMPPDLIPHYQSFTKADLSRLRQAGYTLPMTPLEKGVETYLSQYLMSSYPYR